MSALEDASHEDQSAAGRGDALLVAMLADSLYLGTLFKEPSHVATHLLVENASRCCQCGGEVHQAWSENVHGGSE